MPEREDPCIMAHDPKTQPPMDFEWDSPLDGPAAPSVPQPSTAASGGTDPHRSEGDRGESPNLALLLDIPLEITAELGRTRMIINDLLQLGQGSVIELNKLAGEPLEILVNQKLIARGEVVVVNEKFGIRLTDIISPVDRIKQLG